MNYRDIIKEQMKLLPNSRIWWPKYFYHFTDIRNALEIIDKGWIYARHKATESKLMHSDNASPSVILVSSSKIKDYARLYFRPKTPTQYHNEGYKPEEIRQSDINANCPVPVFFFLDAEKVLLMDGVKFSEKTCAGYSDLDLKDGEDSYSKLPFDKIYHEGWFSPENRDDIIKHRQAEVVRQDGICITDCLKGIVCRSVAEKQTLLYLLKKQFPEKYQVYKNKIIYDPKLDLFYNNGVFIRYVTYSEDGLLIVLNDKAKRRSYSEKNALVNCVVTIFYCVEDNKILDREIVNIELDYLNQEEIQIELKNKVSDYAIVKVEFDNIVMYNYLVNLSIDSII